MKSWFSEEGRYFCLSSLIHAVVILSLGLLQWDVLNRTKQPIDESEIASFKPIDSDQGESPDVKFFEKGNPQLDPSVLNQQTLIEWKDLPVGVSTGERDLRPEEIGSSGGGTREGLSNLISSGLGNIRGENRKGPGSLLGSRTPGGRGEGDNPGLGGKTTGIGDGKRPTWGPTGPSERAVAAALNWLARHQTARGAWSLDHRKECKGGSCSGAGLIHSDTAATAMAILPFLAAGSTHRTKGRYEKHLAKGLGWLMKQQKESGDLSGVKDPFDPKEKPMYAHAIATLALCEAYAMTKDNSATRDEALGSAARKAVAYLERAQNESTGGWRYTPNTESDTSVFGWVIMALKSAQMADIPVNSYVFDRAPIWLNAVAKGEHLGLYSYQPYREVTPTMTAVGMLCREYLGIDPKSPSLLEGKAYLLENLPDDNLGRNTYYWYYATLALHNFDDKDWDTWHRKMRRILIESQAKEGCATGSWDPERPSADIWGVQGGRLMMTSFNTLTLEVYYRYLPLFKKRP